MENYLFFIIFLIFVWCYGDNPRRLETDHRNLTYIHRGASPKVMRWSMVMQNSAYTLLHVPGVEMSIPDAMSRAPRSLLTPELEAVEWTNFTASSSRTAALGVMRVVDAMDDRSVIFDSCHNSTQGQHGIQRTGNEIRMLEYDWPRMTRDVTGWIAECPSCQKVRAKDSRVVAICLHF